MSISQPLAGAPAPRRNLTIAAGAIGNVLEWYDFAAYGFLAQTFARNFFPLDTELMSLLASYGVFAVAFLMRPLGGVLFGHIGDRIGRRSALLLSVLAMAIPSFGIGLLPTYATIGLAAPIALILLRCLQGLSVGGELTVSIVYLGEESERRNRTLAACWTFVGANIGALIGSTLIGLLNTTIGPDAVLAWGWRLPFLGSGVIGLAALLLRMTGVGDGGPPPVRTSSAPIVTAFRTERRGIVTAFLICIPSGVAYYIGLVYVTNFVTRFDSMPAAEADYIASAGMLMNAIAIPFFAALADRIGRRRVMLAGAIGMVLYALPMFWMLTQHSPILAWVAVLCFAVMDAAYDAPLAATLAMRFRPEFRCSAAAISHNAAMATLGGTAPMIAIYLIARTGIVSAPAWYMVAAEAAGLLGLLLSKPDPDQSGTHMGASRE